ncbi:ATP-binding cassette domain-containing protein [Rathayibacter tanaceti]|uniref:ATP-binding cassette domain-containing protein n=1 Tax=Rathayibacter tanaceti TaxID=1671680 RepID=A0AAE6V550_9MICO|nr:ATP-binding cassette domain-containing protein [Rathayibacter tanaceti]
MADPKRSIALDDVRLARGRRDVLRGLSLTIDPGLTVVLGRNGAGKSTLLEALAEARPPSSGSIVIGARALDEGSRERRAVWQRSASWRRRSDSRCPLRRRSASSTAAGSRVCRIGTVGGERETPSDSSVWPTPLAAGSGRSREGCGSGSASPPPSSTSPRSGFSTSPPSGSTPSSRASSAR